MESMNPRRPSRRAYLLVCALAVLLVLLPFLFWYGTWFGRKLTDAQIDEYLADRAKPRHAQHALVQIGERVMRRQPVPERWYPKIGELASDPKSELRQTAAWIMGQDHRYPGFPQTLRKMLADTDPMVRRNAALALSSYGDSAALPELRAMLKPYAVTAPSSGFIKYRLKAGEQVSTGTLIARVGQEEIRSPLPGEVLTLGKPDNAGVHPGETVVEISPSKDHVWEALRALVLVGTLEDLDAVRRYARGAAGMPEKVQRQAMLTADAIERRGASQGTP